MRSEWHRELGRSANVCRREIQCGRRDCSLQAWYVGLRVWLRVGRKRAYVYVHITRRHLILHLGSGKIGMAHTGVTHQHSDKVRRLAFEE